MGSCCSSVARPPEQRLRHASAKWTDDAHLLHLISGRLFMNGATPSNSACLYTQQGKKGTNQDAMIVWENFGPANDSVFCGVFDGHGPFGHLVAKKVRDSLPLMLSSQWTESEDLSASRSRNANAADDDAAGNDELDDVAESLEETDQGSDAIPEPHLPLKRAMLKAFKLMDKELKLHPTIDCFCSGTTAVTLLKQGQDLLIGNLGDSRAVLAVRENDNSLNAIQLTVDLKPDLPREAARIQQCKGRVFSLQDEPDVARVWLPNSDSPGLAMARAFGDFCLKDFGLISIPDIFYRCLTERDEFIILATDGVWDVLSNKEAIDVVASAPTHATAARALVDSATRAWRLKYPTSKNDDCAAVCLFLENCSTECASMEKNGRTSIPKIAIERTSLTEENNGGSGALDVLETSHATQCPDEIVPASKSPDRNLSSKGDSKRSLAECISVADEEWSALEGITRVNSLLSLPRFLSADKKSASWRKWL